MGRGPRQFRYHFWFGPSRHSHCTADDDIPAWIDDARRRLAADGWSLGPLKVQDDGFRGFEAETPDLQLRVHAFAGVKLERAPGTPVMYPPAAIVVQSKAPTWLPALSGAAFLVSLLTGWLLTGWVIRRLRRHPLRPAAYAVSTVAPGGAVALAILVDGLLLMGGLSSVARAAINDPDPLTKLLMLPTMLTFPLLAFLAAMAVLAGLATLLAAAVGPIRPAS